LLLVVIPREVGQFWAFVNRLYFGDNLKWLSDRKEFPDPGIEGVDAPPQDDPFAKAARESAWEKQTEML
jgi:hypothetical protein